MPHDCYNPMKKKLPKENYKSWLVVLQLLLMPLVKKKNTRKNNHPLGAKNCEPNWKSLHKSLWKFQLLEPAITLKRYYNIFYSSSTFLEPFSRTS